MSKYVAVFEDRIDNCSIFETNETDKDLISELAWESAYEVALSDIKHVEWEEYDSNSNHLTMVAIPKAEYDSLIIDTTKYHCLENVGVNNWSDYEYAIKEFEEITGGDW